MGAVVSILKDVVSAEHLQDELPVFFAPSNGATESRMSSEHLRPRDDRVGDDRRQLGGLLVEKRCEPIEVGERIVRPEQLY